MLWLALVMAQDVDGDGVPDAEDACVSVAGSQTFELGPVAFLPLAGGDGFYDAAAGDLDGDGDVDLVTSPMALRPQSALTLYMQQADGTYELSTLPVSWPIAEVQVVDLDGDGFLDILSNDAIFWRNDGAGAFEEPDALVFINVMDATGAVPMDVDGDGDLDVLSIGWVYEYYGRTDLMELWWHENLGGGQFAIEQVLDSRPGYGWALLEAGDVDGDGDGDVVFADSGEGELGWFELEGPVVVEKHLLPTVLALPSGVEVADLDGDGDLDVAAVGWRDDAAVWLEQRAGAWVEHVLDDELDNPGDIHVVDLNADGLPDLLVAADDGTRFYAGPDLVAEVVDTGPGSTAFVGDLDGTGTPDLVLGYRDVDTLLTRLALQPADTDLDGICDGDDPCPLDDVDPCVDEDGDGYHDVGDDDTGTADTGTPSLTEPIPNTTETGTTDTGTTEPEALLAVAGDAPEEVGGCSCHTPSLALWPGFLARRRASKRKR